MQPEDDRCLQAPRYAMRDRHAHEVLRVWTGKTEYVSITDKLYKDPATWGMLLCQVARHVANSYDMNRFATRAEALREIRRQFLETFDDPSTDSSTGTLTDG